MSVKAVSVTYEVNGPKLRRVMEECGLRQIDLATACGHRDGTRICHIMSKKKIRMTGEKLRPIVNLLSEHGAEIEGFHG